MISINDNHFWSVLITLKQSLKVLDVPFEFVIIVIEKGTFKLHINKNISDLSTQKCVIIYKDAFPEIEGNHTHIKVTGLLEIDIQSKGILKKKDLDFLKIYLPYALLSAHGKERKKSVTVSHFAQSLDGKIATNIGNSQWIGNEENLIHSHRMRALCDAILIGTNTLRNDSPSLTVRKVDGENPIKIVMGTSKSPCFDSLQKQEEKIIYLTSNEEANCESVDRILIKSENKSIDCVEIISQLFQRGIYSIYIEGGGRTASSFLESKKLDIVQLHIAPMIMGSGISNFLLPEITSIIESVAFKNHSFIPMGSHIMFTGEVETT